MVMPRRIINVVQLSWILALFVLQTNVAEAGPTKRSTRMTREIYPEIEPSETEGNQAQVCIVGDVVYGVDELVPAEQPCLKCRCQPPGVQCETIKCAKKSGCKVIHRPNKCCPDYQCECYHEGRIYANGERLKSPPEGECKVCYCRGGEMQCADVSCYIRTDCEGKTVPGQCCPKYDHCPPIDPLFGRPTPTAINPQVLELWPLSQILPNSSESTNYDVNKIDTTKESATIENIIKITRATQNDFTEENTKQIEQPKITIQEIIPEIKEIPITESSASQLSEESKALDDSNVNDLVVTDAEPDSSEISEVFQQPPPVLRIGDKLLFLKQGGELIPEKDASTPTSVITIIGAEGLQRGFEDSAEIHETPTKIYENNSLFNNSNDLEPKTSESTHILSLVKHKRKSVSTTTTTTTEPTTIGQALTEEITTKPEISTISEEPTTEITMTETTPIFEDNLTNVTNAKILPEVLEIRNNNTIPSNVTHGEWLKSSETDTPSVSDLIPTQESSTSQEATTEDSLETTTELERSMESIEETIEDSGENTTPKDNHASILSDENASVEPSGGDTAETIDMVKSTTNNPKVEDVEMFEGNKTEVSTVKPEEIISNVTKIIDKRENSPQEEADEIFQQLEAELNADHTERAQTYEEEKEESQRVFQELLEETSTPKSMKKGDKNAETLQRVTDALAKITLRGNRNSLDSGLLGVISNFFGSQYRQNGKK